MDVRTGAALAFRLLGIMMFACSAGDVSASTHEDAAPPCPSAAWAMADGTTLDIAPSDHSTLRWRRPDGTTGVLKPRGRGRWTSTYGWTGRPDGHHVVVTLAPRAAAPASRVEAVLASGQSLTVSTPRQDGAAARTVTITRRGETTTVEAVAIRSLDSAALN